MAISNVPSARSGSPETGDTQVADTTTSAPTAPLSAVPGAPGEDEPAFHGGQRSGRAPQWPSTGWALQPRHLNGQPERVEAHGLGSTAGVVLACLAIVGGLFAWVAFNGFAGATNHAWEVVPKGQPYYVAMIKPDVPASAASQKLPPMVVTKPSDTVTLKIDAPPLGGMYGGTGKVQDAYSPAYFAVPAGTEIHVTVINYDTGWHTFTSPVLGLNVWVRPAGTHPSTTTFTFTAPKSGYFEWFCNLPCNPYSMQHPGYMEGEVHAVRS